MEKYIEDPETLQVNKLPPRSYYIPRDSLCLNGEWEFQLLQDLRSALDKVESKQLPNLSSIHVPGHWQLQGFGSPQYTNFIYPIPMNPPYVPSRNPTGIYRTKFKLNVEPGLHRLRFDGVDSAYYVFLNGQFVGYAQGSRNPSEFDITNVVNNQNELIVVVVQWCDGSYIEDQDQWWLSGGCLVSQDE
jgi:beta-galactosidase